MIRLLHFKVECRMYCTHQVSRFAPLLYLNSGATFFKTGKIHLKVSLQKIRFYLKSFKISRWMWLQFWVCKSSVSMSTLGSGHPAHSNSPRGQQPACPGEPASPDHPETFRGVSWSLLKRGHVAGGGEQRCAQLLSLSSHWWGKLFWSCQCGYKIICQL